MAEGRLADAAEFFGRRAESLEATEEDFRQLGKALANLGRMDAAVSAWERMHERFPATRGGGRAAPEAPAAPARETRGGDTSAPPGRPGTGKKLSFRKPAG